MVLQSAETVSYASFEQFHYMGTFTKPHYSKPMFGIINQRFTPQCSSIQKLQHRLEYAPTPTPNF
jgi:hypothetical protein